MTTILEPLLQPVLTPEEWQITRKAAIALYHQSLKINESINDVRGKAATLHEMAGLKAQQGDKESCDRTARHGDVLNDGYCS